MKRPIKYLAAAVLPSFVLAIAPAAARQQSPQQQAFLSQYCITCHNQTSKTAGLTLDTMELDHVEKNAETWERVVRKIRTGMMPPSGARRPDRAVLDGFAADLESRLDRAAATTPDVGRPALHRLNRVEYGNAVRDLLAMEIDVAVLLPSDDSVEGFDNIADALGVSPTLIQGYVSAAMKISRRAVGDRTLQPTQVTYTAPIGLKQDAHFEGLPLGTRGGMLIQHTFPLDAEYQISAGGGRGGGGSDITIDGERPSTGPAGGGGAGRGAGPGAGGAPAAAPRGGAAPGRGGAGGRGGAPGAGRGAPGGARGFAAAAGGQQRGAAGPGQGGARGGGGGGRVWVTAGPHVIGIAVPEARRQGNVDSAYSDFRVDSRTAVGGGISAVTITGPYNPAGPGDTPSRRAIFICKPASPAEEAPCAQKIVSALARRAFRSQAAATAALDGLMEFYKRGAAEGGFESGVQQVVARILVSPRFLFRMEEESTAAGSAFRLKDIDLAARLSFFLWSSIPDEELLDLAEKGKLSDPATLEAQTRRMLNDPKSDALVENFAGQWLYLRDLSSAQPDTKDFDDNLRQAMRRETEMLFESVVREDRSIVTLLDADYTFVNARLATHYGIPDIRGDYFRRISLAKDSPRRGILGQGSILTVTSTATRTSPVLRGKWILQNVLGTPPPVPPPGVEVNLDAPANAKPTTLRARLEAHRTNPVCASCHKIMDPLGFSLENFDLIGKWRTLDNGLPIDATGTLVDGSPVAGIADLRKAVLARSDSFVTITTERLMTYALGRPVEYFDLPTVRAIVRGAQAKNNSFSALVLGIVKSAPFQTKMKKTL